MGRDVTDKRLARLLPVERWPTAEEAAGSRLFSPVRLGPFTLATRTWVPAMVPWRATADGGVTERNLAWYRRFAEGRPGALVVEATGIRDVPSGPLLRIGDDRFVEGLSRLAEVVHQASGGETRLFIQLIDFLRIRRRPDPKRFFAEFLRVDEGLRARLAAHLGDPALEGADEAGVRARLAGLAAAGLEQVLSERDLEALRFGDRERVTDVEVPAIRDLPRALPGLFAAAARRAKAAGFDGVELHCAHAYTLASFLSRLNTRTDGYGGDLEGRARLPLEVYRAVRAEVGEGYPVGARLLTDEIIGGGSRVADAIHFATAFARAGMDYLSLSRGGKFEDARQPKVGHAAYPYTGPSGQACMPTVGIDAAGPFGRNVPDTARVRRALREAGHGTPVVVAGGIATFDQAEGILARGEADVIGTARQALADPDWLLKVRTGHGAEVRRCFFTNYCEGLDQAHKTVTCQRWDRRFPEGEGHVPLDDDGRRRLTAPPWRPPGPGRVSDDQMS